jgi:hypothetical protein
MSLNEGNNHFEMNWTTIGLTLLILACASLFVNALFLD